MPRLLVRPLWQRSRLLVRFRALMVRMSAKPKNSSSSAVRVATARAERGGDRAPALINSRSLRSRNESQIRDLIKNGTRGEMPAFALAEPELQSLAAWVTLAICPHITPGPLATWLPGSNFFLAAANARPVPRHRRRRTPGRESLH